MALKRISFYIYKRAQSLALSQHLGHYLTAHPNRDVPSFGPGYLLLFCEYSEALGDLNTYSSKPLLAY